MSDILLSPEVSSILFIDLLLLFILSIALFHTLIILKAYNTTVMSAYQYTLEKRSYLVVTIIWVALLIKITLFPFFTYTLNELSNIIPGAMCAAGVIGSNVYGEPLLILKIVVILLVLLWMLLNREDIYCEDNTYFRKKMFFFIGIFFILMIEMLIEVFFLTALSSENPVLCCSAIYIDTEDINPLPFQFSVLQLLIFFYLLYMGLMAAAYWKKRLLLLALSLFFSYIAYYAIVYFFSTYVYELPSHQCPFCLLQSEYYYIGYAIFGLLFIASFYAIAIGLFQFMKSAFLKVIFWYSLFMLLVSFPFILYILVNGVLL